MFVSDRWERRRRLRPRPVVKNLCTNGMPALSHSAPTSLSLGAYAQSTPRSSRRTTGEVRSRIRARRAWSRRNSPRSRTPIAVRCMRRRRSIACMSVTRFPFRIMCPDCPYLAQDALCKLARDTYPAFVQVTTMRSATVVLLSYAARRHTAKGDMLARNSTWCSIGEYTKR